MKIDDNLENFKKRVRGAVANYMMSEGCSCCQDVEQHVEDTAVLAYLLDVPKRKDGEGYDFFQFCTEDDLKD